ncbi:MAG: Ldh family oxidoreductase [Chloroflexi bacterium]|nr:Ldh family oxidoreductase [Chloroflexota bacterium]
MSAEAEIVRVPATTMEEFDTEAFCKVGMLPGEASLVAQSIVHADLTGVFTHGSNFLPLYTNWIQVGSIDPTATPEVVSDNGATAIISARNAMGQVAGVQAMDMAIAKAKEFGIGAVGVRESNHFGAAAYYTLRALDHDAIGFCSTNGIQVMAPYGGVTPSLSNTPIAYAIPANEERPLMLDMAVSVVAAGKVALAKRKGESIPLDWALTAEGVPTDDPSIATLMAPVGGPKGYGLAVVLDALCGVLTGALFGQDVRRGGIPNTPQAMGQLFMALDVGHMMPVDEFKQRMDVQIRQMRDSDKAKGVDRIYLPGEIELERKENFLRDGIAFATEIVEDLDAMSGTLGIASLSSRL